MKQVPVKRSIRPRSPTFLRRTETAGRSIRRPTREGPPVVVRPHHALGFAAALVCASIVAPAAARAVPARDTAVVAHADAPSRTRIGRDDLAFLALGAGAVAYAAHNDVWLADETTEAHSTGEDRLARWVQPLGNSGVLLPALALSYGAARWSRHLDAARSLRRVGLAAGVAGGMVLVLKEAVGRSRPFESPNDPSSFHPFTGHTSFPSGHAALAFAAAAAIDRETARRWVPWMAYPSAGLLAWSRVHDRQHWTSDVVAGAVIGSWTGWKTDSWLQARDGRVNRMSLLLLPGPEMAGLFLRF